MSDPRLGAVIVELRDYLPDVWPPEGADGGRTVRACAERVLAAVGRPVECRTRIEVSDEMVDRARAVFLEDPDPFADPSWGLVRTALEAALSPETPEEEDGPPVEQVIAEGNAQWVREQVERDERAARQLGWYPEMPVDMARLREKNERLRKAAELIFSVPMWNPYKEGHSMEFTVALNGLRAALSQEGETE